jgi:hypothetical protein
MRIFLLGKRALNAEGEDLDKMRERYAVSKRNPIKCCDESSWRGKHWSNNSWVLKRKL